LRSQNAELACVSKGREWKIFRGNRLGDGKDTLDGLACAFGSLKGVQDTFKLFFDLLSYDAVTGYKYRAIFREQEKQGSSIVHVVRSIPKRATRAVRRMLKRRAAIEPTIGHLKSGNRMDRNYLTGQEGDRINALLSAAGYNLRKLLRWVVFAPIFWLWHRLLVRLTAEAALRRAPLLPTPA
jgi:hypothetical protein